MKISRTHLVQGSVIIILIWGTLLRLNFLDASSYWLDEGYSVTIGQAIAQHGYPLLDSGESIWRSPLYHYLLGIWIALFGTGELATRLLSVGFGLSAILLLAFTAKRWFGTGVAYITLVLASFATWEIVWSRQARMYMALQALFWLAVLVFQWWHKSGAKRTGYRWWLMVLTLGVALLTHEFALLLLIILPGYVLLQRWAKQPQHLAWYIVGLFLILPLLIGLLYYGLHQPVPVNYWSHYLAFGWREHAIVLILAAMSVAIVKRAHLPLVFWLSTAGLFGVGLFSFGITLLHYRYLFFLYPIIIWLAAYTIHWVWEWRRKWLSAGMTVVIGVALLWHHEISLLPQTFWPLESDPKTSAFSYKSFSPQPNFRAAYEVIAQQQPTMVITPYPELSRLYLGRDDTYALYIDVLGSANQPSRPQQIYTGVPYLTLVALKQARASQAVILLDYFSTRRIQPELRQYIEQYGQVIYTAHTNEWSTVTVYKF